jgi:hypothetical protein
MDFILSNAAQSLGIKGKPEFTSYADETKHTQGIVEKGLPWREWCPHYASIQIVQASASKVGNLSVLQVEEQGIQ